MKSKVAVLIGEHHARCLFCLLISLFFFYAGAQTGRASEKSKPAVFVAHVASFKSEASAEKYSKSLEKQGRNSWIKKMNVPGKGEFERVYIGFFDSRKSAVTTLQALKRDGVIPYFAIEQQEAAGESQGKNEALPKVSEKKLSRKTEIPKDSSTAVQKKELEKKEKPSAKVETIGQIIESASKTDRQESKTLRKISAAPVASGTDASFYYNEGIKYLVKEQFDQALSSFSQAIRLNSKYTEGYIKRGDAWYLKGDYEMAVNDYNTAIALKPDYSESYLGRGLAYKNLGQVKKSEEDFRHACHLGSEEACTLLNVLPKSSVSSR